jgi:hypothetical protein
MLARASGFFGNARQHIVSRRNQNDINVFGCHGFLPFSRGAGTMPFRKRSGALKIQIAANNQFGVTQNICSFTTDETTPNDGDIHF